jgi:hypothetical protein
MFVSPAFSTRIFDEPDDRRDRQRFPYPASVKVDGRPASGRDLSATGISVFVAIPQIGSIVDVALPKADNSEDEITYRARVVRIDRTPSGYVVALEFLE